MSPHPLLGRVLVHLFRLSAPADRCPAGRTAAPLSPPCPGVPPAPRALTATPVTRVALAAATGLPEARLREALAVLERAGLVVAGGPRLTLAGLAVAAALRARAVRPRASRSSLPRRPGRVAGQPAAGSPPAGTETSRTVRVTGVRGEAIPSAA